MIMQHNINGTRYKNFYRWEYVKNEGYNYEREGLLKRIMSAKIINTKNSPLKTILDYYEASLVFLMRYVDILKNFKNPCWKNR